MPLSTSLCEDMAGQEAAGGRRYVGLINQRIYVHSMDSINKPFLHIVMMICAYVRSTPLSPHSSIFRLSVIPTDILQGAYWGTAYAAYSLIHTPGYGVSTWDLHNEDLIRPLYVGQIQEHVIESLLILPVDPGV